MAGNGADYNVFNTSLYAAGFAVAAAYIGYPLLERLEVELDRRFFTSITPYILLGGSLRVLHDTRIIDSFLLVTPFIYFVMFGFTVVILVSTKKLLEDNYHRVFGLVGVASLIATLSLYSYTSLTPLFFALALFGLSAGGLYLLTDRFSEKLAVPGFLLPVAAHYWDAATSVTVLVSGGSEKHLLAQKFVGLMGPAGMFVMKTAVIVPATYYIFTEMEGRKKGYYLFLVALLGLALGTRNILTVTAS